MKENKILKIIGGCLFILVILISLFLPASFFLDNIGLNNVCEDDGYTYSWDKQGNIEPGYINCCKIEYDTNHKGYEKCKVIKRKK